MTDGRTAQDRLLRLLHVLPAAARPGGARLVDLAAELDVPESRILQDLEEVTERNFYHPGGWLDDVQILLQADRVEVSRADGFERPTRLTPEETLCLALALRGSAASAHVNARVARERLLDRAEGLSGPPRLARRRRPGHRRARPTPGPGGDPRGAPGRRARPPAVRHLVCEAGCA
jgi:proteasome accessory factor C